MTIGIDMTTILSPSSPEEDTPLAFVSTEWSFETGGIEGSKGVLEFEWGRAPGSESFQVEIIVNRRHVTARVPPVMIDDHLQFERVFIPYGLNDGANSLRLESVLSTHSFYMRSITVVFKQDLS